MHRLIFEETSTHGRLPVNITSKDYETIRMNNTHPASCGTFIKVTCKVKVKVKVTCTFIKVAYLTRL